MIAITFSKSKLLAMTFAIFLLCFPSWAADISVSNFSRQYENYEINLEYPKLRNSVVPTWQLINQEFFKVLLSDGCDIDEAKLSDIGFYYDANATIHAISASYVAFRINYSVYCGGAHPSHGIGFKVYDAVTGKLLDIASEVPIQIYERPDFNYGEYEKFQVNLAKLILRYLGPNEDVRETCPESIADPVSIVSTFSPRIVALGENKTVTILTYPPHVISVCQFYVSVPFNNVKQYFPENSVIHHRMD